MIGFILFLISEVLLFVSFFWAYFYSSLTPDVLLGAQWPPVGIHKIDPWSIPLLGSCILLGAGFILTLGHHLFIQGNKDLAVFYMAFSVIIGATFIWLQYTEYLNTAFTISDSVYGSIFFITTGLHGIHVIIGILFLLVATVRMYLDSFTINHNLGLEASIIYFHLIDLIWLVLF
jgi:cytochrome c oxidase subunit 3